MTLPATTVKIAFDLSGVDPNFFTLDDPVKGELDNVTYLLAGDILQDVSDYVRRVSISRGRSRELDRYSTGQASVVLDNRSRRFDPTDVATPYLGQIIPRKAVEVSTGTDLLMAGNVQDWQYAYDINGDATTTVSMVDGFGILARQEIDNIVLGTATSGARVEDILDATSWPAGKRSVAAGSATLAAGSATGNALSLLQEVETVEAGDFFMSRTGVATFKARGVEYDPTDYDAAVAYDSATTTYSYPLPAVTTDLVFTDESADDRDPSTDVPYATLALELGTDLLYNTVEVTVGTATVTVQDVDSQATYGAASLRIDGGLFLGGGTAVGDYATATAAGTALAEYLIERYRQPVVRFAEVGVDLHALPTAVQSKVLQLDLTDVVPVRFRPGSTGGRVEKRQVIEGISHDIGPDRHRITFRFSGAPGS